jgi:fatty acid amide hydrolase
MLRALGRRSVDDYWTLCAAQQDYVERFDAAMDASAGGALDLLLGPAVATPAFTHGAAKFLGVPGIYTTLYDLLGWPAGVVPVTRVHAGEESDRPKSIDIAERTARAVEQGSVGLPLGVQIAGRPWREDQVLAAMTAIESACAYI